MFLVGHAKRGMISAPRPSSVFLFKGFFFSFLSLSLSSLCVFCISRSIYWVLLDALEAASALSLFLSLDSLAWLTFTTFITL